MKKWLYVALPALVILSFFSGVYVSTNTIQPAEILDGVGVDITPKKIDEMKVEELVNIERVKAGLNRLEHNDILKDSACAKLDDMVAKNYWAHDSPDGTKPWFWFDQAGYKYTAAGENLAYGQINEERLVSDWVRSYTHYKVIKGDYTQFAVCIKASKFQGGYNNLIVNHFGKPL